MTDTAGERRAPEDELTEFQLGAASGSPRTSSTRRATTARSARPTWSPPASRGSGGSTTPATPASTGRPSTGARTDGRAQRGLAVRVRARRGAVRCSTWSGWCSPAARCCASARPSSSAQHLRRDARRRTTCGASCSASPAQAATSAGLTTKAERDGDHFIVNGQKVWCSGGRYSNWGILMARTDPDAPKHEGISFFLLPDEPARRRDPSAEADDRRGRVRRGVLHRRASCRPTTSSVRCTAAGASAWPCSPASAATSATSVVGLERRLEAMSEIGATATLGPGRAPAAGRADRARATRTRRWRSGRDRSRRPPPS